MGVAENVIVKIDKFVFSVDFGMLDMEEDFRISIILGRPFLTTAHAIIDVFNKKISFKVGNEKIIFDIEKSMKFSSSYDDICNSFDMVYLTIKNHVQKTLLKDQLDSFLFEHIKYFQPSKGINLWEDDSEVTMDEEKLQNSLDSPTASGLFSDLDDFEPDNLKTRHFLLTTNGNKKEWADKLNDALCAFRTAYKSPIRSTPFRIIYGKVCHLPIEMEHKAYWGFKNVNLDLDVAGRNRFLQLNKLAEMRNEAYEHSRAYKERTKRQDGMDLIRSAKYFHMEQWKSMVKIEFASKLTDIGDYSRERDAQDHLGW
ncbi:reverse transcriptase domain-containing protein [Tanacetum coccineum]